MSDEKLMDGLKLTLDAHDAGKEAGRLVALREMQSLLQELTDAIRDRIAAIESRREEDD